jgi:energy-coupling factor transporter ATP-binding protein EcfA2
MNNNLSIIQTKGKEMFGEHFHITPEDYEVVHKLLTWFLQDEKQAQQFGINLNKGILLTGPIGCGKTSLMSLMRVLVPPQQRFGIKSCREITFNFIKDGYDIYNATAVMLTTTQQIHRNPIPIASMIWGLKALLNTTAINAMSWAKSYYPGMIILSTITWSHTPPPTSPPPSSKAITATESAPV